MSNYDLTRNNLDKLIGVTDKLRSLVTELKSELQTELIRLRLIELKEMTAVLSNTATSDVLGKVIGANIPLDV